MVVICKVLASRVIALEKPDIQNIIYAEMAGTTQQLLLEVRMRDRPEILDSLHTGSERLRAELRSHVQEGHGERYPVLGFLRGSHSRCSSMFDTPRSTYSRGSEIPGAILVWANVVHDAITVRTINVLKGMLKSAQRAIGGQRLETWHIPDVTPAEVQYPILSRRRCTACGGWSPEDNGLGHISELQNAVRSSGRRDVDVKTTGGVATEIEMPRESGTESVDDTRPITVSKDHRRDDLHWI